MIGLASSADGEPRWRVFISHTSELQDFPSGGSYVAKVKEAISAAGHVIVDMADFPAAGQPSAQLCASRVRGCEVYVGVLGTRYGSPVPDRPEVSYTELEFDTAAAAGLDRLVFLLDTDAANVGIPVSKLIDHKLGARQEAFRHRVQNSGVVTQFFADPASLGQLVERSLQQLAKTRARINSENAPEQVRANREVPRQLPATVADFTGRVAELQALTRMLDQAGTSTPGTVVISAIGGTAGVGKSALALHWAHQVATRFPDGQLYVNLHGFDPSGNPTAPTEATRGFLDALGVPPERIPASPEAQAGLYRSLLADKRVLILLDNARDEQQVRPLLPASPGILVLVTSRSQLAGLGAAGGARLISLDVLSHAEAVQLLAARLGPVRAAAQPAAVGRIAALCACLPLALAVAAARAAARATFPLAALAAELADSARRLDALDAGDPGSSVRPVFSWSVRQLTSEAARIFRLLGIHPGPDICVPAAASLAGRSEPRAHRLLRELADAHLIAEHVPGRYVFHDLLRAYAAEQACDTDSDTDRREATGRVLDHYLHTAARAARVLDPAKEPVALASLRPGAAAGQPTDLQQALAWFEAEHQGLLAALTLANGSGFDTHTWQLAWAMKNFLQARGYRQELAAAQRAALAAATRLGDAAAQAVCSRLLGVACIDLGDHDGARAHLASSLALYQRLSNQLGQGKVHQNLGFAAEREGRSTDALAHAEQALRLYRTIGDEANEAAALNGVGWCYGLLGDYQQAQAFCRQALVLSAKTGHRWVEAAAWDSLGVAEHHLGNLAEAAACFQRALSLYPECGERVFEVETLTRLGDTRHAADDLAQAREAWQQALAIGEDLQHPFADKIRAKLASTKDQGSANLSA
jgi:tetratricopeptide (TPR) repeat protein